VLDEIATTLQRIAVIQVAGADAVEDEDELESLTRLAGDIEPERIQLYYQMAVRSRGDLLLAPDPRIGFEMALLRMLAFRPAGGVEGEVGGGSVVTQSIRRAAPEAAKPRRKAHPQASSPVSEGGPRGAPQSASKRPKKPAASAPDKASVDDIHNWPDFVAGLSLDGAASQLAAHSALETYSPFEIRLSIERRNEHLLTDNLKSRLTVAIEQRIGSSIGVHFSLTDQALETAAARADDHSEQAMRRAHDAIENDPDVRQLVDVLGGEVVENSIQPIDCEPAPGQDQG
jgi:DNA polymerase-3 subunit gamma/tau